MREKSHKNEEARRGESTRPGEESRQTFLQLDFDDLEDVAQVLQHAEGGEKHRAGRDGGGFPPRSHFAALADPMGLSGNELPPGTGGIQESGVASRGWPLKPGRFAGGLLAEATEPPDFLRSQLRRAS